MSAGRWGYVDDVTWGLFWWFCLAVLVVWLIAGAIRLRNQQMPSTFEPFICDDCGGEYSHLNRYGHSRICDSCEDNWVALERAINETREA